MERMDHLLGTFDSGRILREGLSVLLLGRPNAGKSSLMNALLGESRAIVTEIPGTTRDIIEESLNIGSLPLRLIDTAGIRHTDDLVEMEGMRRARHKVATSDLVLLVVDGSTPLDREDQLALDACGDARVLLVVNKSDLPPTPMISPFTDLPSVTVSSHTGEGMDRLRSAIENVFSFETSVEGRESPMLSDRRHREALFRARQALGLFYDGSTDNLSPEFLALDLRDALRFLGEITGETTPDDILDRIFSRFCIGK
jgi:tRNA modification GTPase